MPPKSGPRAPIGSPFPSQGCSSLNSAERGAGRDSGQGHGEGTSTHLAAPRLALLPGHKSTWTEITSRINLALNSSPKNVSTKFSPRRTKQN